MCSQITGRTAGREPSYRSKTIQRHFCKIKCCEPCSYCPRAFAKERNKSRGSRLSSFSKESYSKICERCFLCHSIVLCPTCNKCQKCCHNLSCRGSIPTLLESLAGARGRSEGNSFFERGLPPPLPDSTQAHKISHSRKLLCQSSQGQLPDGGITSTYRQKCSGTSSKSKVPRVFQPAISSSETKQQVETYPRPEQTKSLPQGGEIQDGDAGNHQVITPTRGMGHIHRLSGRLFPYSNTGTIQEIFEISRPRANIPIQGPAVRPVHSPLGVYCGRKGGETDGHTQGYKNPPVPRRLVGEIQIPQNLSPPYPSPDQNVPGPRLAGEFGEIRAGTQTDLRLCRLPVRPQVRSGQTYTGPVAKPSGQDTSTPVVTGLSGPIVHVPDRPANSHRKTGSPRPTTHETYTVASQEQLEGTRISREDYPPTKVPAPPLTMVARGRQCASRPTTTPSKTCSADIYRRIKRRVGRSLKRVHCKRDLVGASKQTAHKLSRTQSGLPGPQRVSKPLCRQNGSGGNRQHYGGSLHKQGRRHEVGPTVCPTMENLDLVLPETSDSKSPTHPRPFKCDSRQAIQAGSDHPNRMVPPSGSFPTTMQSMTPASNRPICHEVQPQVTSVCLSGTGLPGYSSGCSHPAMGRSGCIRLPTDRHIGQSGGEAAGLPVQETHSDCPGVAQHALVFGPSEHVQPGPSQPTQPAQSANTALQSDPSQKSDKSKSPCLAPRATKIKEQGFSEAVAARIEAPQRKSTRSVYEAKWTIFTKWCDTNQVDFRSPPVKSVADFLMYLFEDKKLQPSTIDGYRSAIADKLGDTSINISKNDNLTRLLESFHRDRPKGRRGIPSWNLSLVLHQLTKAPFEPLREASLKHVTFKTVFLLALGSGKRRSEIHAWQHKNIRHQSDWSKVSLFPSPSFLSKNQLAKEGPQSVAPVVIPALAPTLDKSLKSDRSLCPIRALRYYLDRTSDLRQHKELVFVSFKKGFDKDISPATISSWIKQTVILCYELSDHQAHTLHQVKAHDVRAFAASKAFQSGVSLEQILAACHWKSHNTFTQFYLKDVAWADSELYHLGPVVAAQQIHQQTGT